MATPLTLQIVVDARRAKPGMDAVKKELREIGTQGDRATKTTDKFNRELQETGRRGREAGRQLDRAGKGFRSFGSATQFATRALGGLVAGFGAYATIRRTISTITDFETSIAQLRGVTGASGASLQQLVDTARETGAATRYTAGQAAQGLLELSRAGLDVSASTKALRPSLDLATAGMLSLAESADLVTNVAAQFKLPADQIERIGNVLVAVSNRSNTNVAQLGEGLKVLGVVASNVNVTLEDTVATLGVLANRGLKGTDGATKLRQAFLKLLDPSLDAMKTLREMGIGLDEVNIQARGLEPVLQTLADAQLDIVEASRLVGVRNAAALVALVQSTEEYRNLGKAAREVKDEMGNLSDALDNTVTGAWKRLNSAIDEVILTSGDGGLSGALRGSLDLMTDLVRGLDQVASNFEDVAKSIAGANTEASKWRTYLDEFGQRANYVEIARQRDIDYLRSVGGRAVGEAGPTPSRLPGGVRAGSSGAYEYLTHPTRDRFPSPESFFPPRGRYSLTDTGFDTPSAAELRFVTPEMRLLGIQPVDDLERQSRVATFAIDSVSTAFGRLGAELASGTADLRDLGRAFAQALAQGFAQEAFSNVGREFASAFVGGLSGGPKSGRQWREDTLDNWRVKA